MTMTNYDYAIRGVEVGVALQAPTRTRAKIAQPLSNYLKKRKELQKRAQIYDATSILKKEIHRLVKKETP